MILTLDSSEFSASVSLINDGKIIYSSFLNDGRTHSQKLMPQVSDSFKSTGVKISDVDAFACSVGPGSFTGLRIGIAAIQGLAYTNKKNCIAINTLDAMSLNIPHFPGLVVPMIDARNEQAYSAIYNGANDLKRVSVDMAKEVFQIAEDVKKLGRDAIFIGSGAVKNKKTIMDILEEIVGDIEMPRVELIKNDDDGGYIIDGRIEIDKVVEFLDMDIDPDVNNTLSGFVIKMLGYVPSTGQTPKIEAGGYEFCVREVRGSLIKSLNVKKIQE